MKRLSLETGETRLYCTVVEYKLHVSRSRAVGFNELFVAFWSLVFGIAREHTLNTHTDTFGTLYWTPALCSQKVEANNAVRVDMRVHRDGTVWSLFKSDLRRF